MRSPNRVRSFGRSILNSEPALVSPHSSVKHKARRGEKAAFDASPAELGRAAVKAARKQR